MAFFRKLAAFTSGVAQALPGALQQRAVYQRDIAHQKERDVEREKDQIRARFASDPEGAIREFEAKGYTDDAARLRGMLTGAERTKLQTASRGYQTEAAGAAGALQAVASPELLATERGRAEATQQLQPLVPRLAAGIGEARALGQQSRLGAAVGVSELAGGVAPMQQALNQLQQRIAQIQEPDRIAEMIEPGLTDPVALDGLKKRYSESLVRLGLSDVAVEASLTRINSAIQEFKDRRAIVLFDDLGRVGDVEGIRRIMGSTTLSAGAEAYGRAKLRVAELVSSRDVDEATRRQISLLLQQLDDAKLSAQFDPEGGSGAIDDVIEGMSKVRPDIAAMWSRSKPLWLRYGRARSWEDFRQDSLTRYQTEPERLLSWVGEELGWDEKTVQARSSGRPSPQEFWEAMEKVRVKYFSGEQGSTRGPLVSQSDIDGLEILWKRGDAQGVADILRSAVPEESVAAKEELRKRGIDVSSVMLEEQPWWQVPSREVEQPAPTRSTGGLGVPFLPPTR